MTDDDLAVGGGNASPPSNEVANGDHSEVVPFALVAGEAVAHVGSTREGNAIVLTNYRIHVSARSQCINGAEAEPGDSSTTLINVPLSCIEASEARDLFFIHILCKDARYYRISFSNNSACEEWQRRVTAAIALPASIDKSFAVTHCTACCSQQAQASETGDSVFRREVTRLGFDLSGSWRISTANDGFGFCPTYPPEILVPACITDPVLERVAAFRSARRVPAVVWRHPRTGAVLARCSQPEVGWLGWRSSDDEELIRAIVEASAFDQPGQSVPSDGDSGRSSQAANGDEPLTYAEAAAGSNGADVPCADDSIPSLKDLSAEAAAASACMAKVLIVDARSYTAAVGNRARGGGVECIEYYPTAEIIFMSLANIHNIRKSFQALRVLCNQTPADAYSGGSGWLAALDATKWLYHASGLLKAATRAATALHCEGRPVLVHCSDGWDRTPQIVSLAQLMLDPYYRSMDGFRTLIEICWLNFGHKMADRNSTVLGVADPNERAPIFLQWLDCVHQLLRQFPCSFEFNQSYLVKLAQHAYSSLFGTFLCNALADRRRSRLDSQTRSVWAFLGQHPFKFRNFLYDNNAQSELWPRCDMVDLVVWKDVYVVPSASSTSSTGTGNGSLLTPPLSSQGSRSDGPSSADQLDTGATSSRDGSEPESKKQDIKLVREELVKLQINTNAELPSQNGTDPCEEDTLVEDNSTEDKKCDIDIERKSSVGSVAEHRLGRQQSKGIESSTDTLVPESDVEERTVKAAGQADVKCQRQVRAVAGPENGAGAAGQPTNGSCPALPTAAYSADASAVSDLSAYFKGPLDSDGLTAHHDAVQQQLANIFVSHQAELQALRRDLHWTRVALLRQKSAGADSRPPAADSADEFVIKASDGPANGHSGSSSVGAGSDGSSSWEAVDEREANPTLWVPDHAVISCMKCNKKFWFGRRKHHCRNCGRLFCQDCSNNLTPIPAEQLYHPVRVCDECFGQSGENATNGELEQPLDC